MSEKRFLDLTAKKTYNLALSGAVGAGPGVGVTLIGGPISFRYRIKKVEVIFRNDSANLLWIYLLISRDTTTSTGGPPSDTNLLAPFGPTAYLLGEGLIKRLTLDYVPDADQKYIKVHALNGCAYAQTINVTVKIQEA